MPLHPFTRRWLAEDLLRVRRPDERERYAASQRQARIDPNPHQVDAVIFALRRLREGGCILADEVGLGKTIEAGLVIAQTRAEGARRVLLIVPKPLIGQWQAELATLFGLAAREEQVRFDPDGIYLVGREFAGSERGAAALGAAPPFDLVVIDEAHEIFAGIHKRYRRDGTEADDSEHARIAHRVREGLRSAPVLLLTATPMQNSLAELWGLVQYVEPTGTLLGDIATFRQLFCAEDDRTLLPGQEHELQRRLSTVLQRTLRRQAQEFLDKPFTQRQCRLYEYAMSEDERALYDDVTEYLMEPRLHAFAGRQRRLLLIGFHRRMASSTAALAASLDRVAARLQALRAGLDPGPADVFAADLEEGFDPPEPDADADADDADPPAVDPAEVAAELARVEALAHRARALPSDAKARSFLEAIRVVRDLGRTGQGSGKAVVFTESITTQDYLRTLLLGAGLDDGDVTLFRGVNDSARAREALARWSAETPLPPAARPSHEVAVRLALVHEFATRSKVLVSTEAGAKGLNLQFCETVINYDLPWNPQRIEQRIGRCHRYRQARDVTVVNFLARDNDAHRLTFDILSQKLDLFGKVLDASDQVLHEPSTDQPELVVGAVSQEFEHDLRGIYARARTLEERTEQIAALRDRIAGRREAYEREYERTAAAIQTRLHEDVRHVFRRFRDELPAGLAALDHHLASLVDGYLADSGRAYRRDDRDGRAWFTLDADAPAELGGGTRFATGDARGLGDVQALNLAHPLVRAALDGARRYDGGAVDLWVPAEPDAAAAALAPWVGQRGVLDVVRVDYDGFEPVQRLVVGAVIDGEPLDPDLAALLPGLRATEPTAPAELAVDERLLADAVDEAVFVDQRRVELAEQAHFERSIHQLERFVDDKILVFRRERTALGDKLRSARTRRDAVVGSDVRGKVEARLVALSGRDEELADRIRALDAREDEVYRKWRDHHHELRYRPPTATRLMRIAFHLRTTATGTVTPC